ncbi:cadmium-translocating P-type ATPase [Pedobacter sp. LMG 31464]|uniref:P-type Zn(2+) transporter n=1 Tax=Pedobacter planticolens TaxID=2679964 RepID=A0A923IWQ9_9SPHI|nr:heavy metal translocating P-type ATPase [Pedobacter planticolens]MBB2145467.1 cadmium-translocating P-type ATPase [Pedobacter planticolens]
MEKEKHQHNKEIDSCCSHNHSHQHEHGDDHDHDHGDASAFKTYLPAIFSLVLLLIAIALDYFKVDFFTNYIRIAWYVVAYIPVAYPVIKEAIQTIAKGEIFTEFLLMALATIGALALGEYPEAVAVMLFYTVGELFQGAAVEGAKRNIKALLDVRPDTANVFRKEKYEIVKPETVEIGETIQLKAGEKAPLDGELINDSASFNTAALTGESTPKTFRKGETVLAGMLNLDQVITLKVTKKFADSALSRILEMVQSATSRKAKTELFIRKFAKIYTPIVFFLAVALVVFPYFIVADYHFQTWLYRALVFLVISCPCALVISIPLGYFGGIGAASANGILFKGSNFLDVITKINTVVLDKTGTLTHGVFKVSAIKSEIEEAKFMILLASIESQSTHPIAKAIVSHHGDKKLLKVNEVKEITGHGLTAVIENQKIVAGNTKLFKKLKIDYPTVVDEEVETIVLLAVDDKYAGYVTITDEVKSDAKQAVHELHKNGVNQVVMLSGDKTAITQKIAKMLGIDVAHGDLLPEDKVARLEEIKKDKTRVVAFVGDGINDAPVLALSDLGMAMGAMGSDVAIETADVVIQNDQPSRIVTAIKIGKATKRVVYQNITLAFAVKAVVLILGAGGLATMWEAVFADVGVAFLAILNAIRIQKMKF